uniref:Small ribosomal subunit protein bS6m n=1 Tax=Anas zonorhyncha TaxID=75864 RepID=A0A8B9ZMV2_9AVES
PCAALRQKKKKKTFTGSDPNSVGTRTPPLKGRQLPVREQGGHAAALRSFWKGTWGTHPRAPLAVPPTRERGAVAAASPPWAARPRRVPRGGARGGRSGNFHSLQHQQAGRRAQARSHRRRGVVVEGGAARGASPSSPLVPPPRWGPQEEEEEEEGGSGPRAGVCGAAAEAAPAAGRGAERRRLRSCRRPLSRAARPPAPVSVPPPSRAGRSRRWERAFLFLLLLLLIFLPSPRTAAPLPPRSPSASPLLLFTLFLLLAPPPSPAMPRYELALILKAMQRPETAAVLKRTVEALMENGAVVRNLENLGERALPYKISKHKQRHRRGGYFLVDLEAPPSIVSTMMDHLGRDIDVIRRAFIKHPVSKTEECSGIIPVSFEDKLTAKKK